jgi:hypothetical protein
MRVCFTFIGTESGTAIPSTTLRTGIAVFARAGSPCYAYKDESHPSGAFGKNRGAYGTQHFRDNHLFESSGEFAILVLNSD